VWTWVSDKSVGFEIFEALREQVVAIDLRQEAATLRRPALTPTAKSLARRRAAGLPTARCPGSTARTNITKISAEGSESPPTLSDLPQNEQSPLRKGSGRSSAWRNHGFDVASTGTVVTRRAKRRSEVSQRDEGGETGLSTTSELLRQRASRWTKRTTTGSQFAVAVSFRSRHLKGAERTIEASPGGGVVLGAPPPTATARAHDICNEHPDQSRVRRGLSTRTRPDPLIGSINAKPT